MRRPVTPLALVCLLVIGCDNPEEAGRRAAQQRAAQETKQEAAAKAADKIDPPVPGGKHLQCEQLINTAQFTEELAEVDQVTVRDNTSSDAEAAAVCSIVRGGERPDQAQQAAISKKNGGRLGTLPGDELCSVSMYCWTIESDAKFRAKCKTDGFMGDESMGTWACLQVVAVGADDVNVYKFLDEDTKCLIKVRGGPSMVDNELINRCARTARDLIGKPQISLDGSAAVDPTAAGSADPAAGSAM
jgi:hypothetical protein